MGPSYWSIRTPFTGRMRVFLQNVGTIRSLFPDSPWIIGGDFNMITSLEEK